MSVASEYADLFTVAGRRVVLERPVADGPPLRVESVRARLWGAAPEEIAGGVSSNERHVIILAADVPASMLPLRKNDKVLIDGLRLTFNERPDDQTHRDGELLLAIEGMVAGS